MEGAKRISFAEGWPVVEDGFNKVVRIVDGSQEKFTSEEYIDIYSKVFFLCGPYDRHDADFYERYKLLVEGYVKNKVLPALAQKEDRFLLEELATRWSNHLKMIRWLSRFFGHLDRYYIPKKGLLSVHDAGLHCFQSLVYDAIYPRARHAFLAMVNEESEGEKVDDTMLKSTAEVLASVKPGDKDYDEELRELLAAIVAAPNQGDATGNQ